ncbi:MAG TPA: DUF2442 domain-containing protein [Agriterribacter sp.]|nr:DUF2442 domain-containing protein [Agriterribacter sp.]
MQVPKVISVEALGDYSLSVVFDNGIRGFVDMSYLAGKGVFRAWDTANTFNQVFINPENNAISWPGEIDIDTINIYCRIKGITPHQFLQQNEYATDK